MDNADHAPTTAPEKHLPVTRVLVTLLCVHAAVVAFSLVSPLLTGQPRGQTQFSVYFDVDYEGNFPTWWSVVQLSVATAMLGITAVLARARGTGGWMAWAALTVLMLLLNLDEGTWLHERFDQIALHLVDVRDFTFVWLVFGIPLAIGVLIIAFLSARRLPRSSQYLILAGFGVLMFAAVGMELVAGALIASREGTAWVAISYHVEEFLELAAVALILVAPLASYRLQETPDGVALRLQPGSHPRDTRHPVF